MYITSGTGTRFVGDHVEGYFAGYVCMIGPQFPHEWRNDEILNDMLIDPAKKRLIEGNFKISVISSEAGFNNLSNFIGQFKRTTNMLPSEFQKKHKGYSDGEYR